MPKPHLNYIKPRPKAAIKALKAVHFFFWSHAVTTGGIDVEKSHLQ
jgi:hypothetical protein